MNILQQNTARIQYRQHAASKCNTINYHVDLSNVITRNEAIRAADITFNATYTFTWP